MLLNSESMGVVDKILVTIGKSDIASITAIYNN